MYICIYIYTYICIHVHMCIYIHTHRHLEKIEGSTQHCRLPSDRTVSGTGNSGKAEQMEEDSSAATRRRVRRATGAVLAASLLCICAVMFGRGRLGGKGTILDIKQLAPLVSLHWVNHEFRKVRPAEYQRTPLEQADRTAERKARTAAKWQRWLSQNIHTCIYTYIYIL